MCLDVFKLQEFQCVIVIFYEVSCERNLIVIQLRLNEAVGLNVFIEKVPVYMMIELLLVTLYKGSTHIVKNNICRLKNHVM